MLELVLIPLGILVVLAMAKRRRYRRYLKGIIDFELALSTLAGNTTISASEAQVLRNLCGYLVTSGRHCSV